MKFRKRPLVISAIRWSGTNVDEVLGFVGDLSKLPEDGVNVHRGIGHCVQLGTLDIPTLEGIMTASPGDWIIRGVKGEIYPCKPDIFEAT